MAAATSASLATSSRTATAAAPTSLARPFDDETRGHGGPDATGRAGYHGD
jgi:hypothetical protein